MLSVRSNQIAYVSGLERFGPQPQLGPQMAPTTTYSLPLLCLCNYGHHLWKNAYTYNYITSFISTVRNLEEPPFLYHIYQPECLSIALLNVNIKPAFDRNSNISKYKVTIK
ncbi:unnamed protein product [Linum trigynum]|uniref:Uncharacterized protein n=1 Tax=Linum trigynum TaxID=586398 RepID=A0AAV2FPG3_9ROSI